MLSKFVEDRKKRHEEQEQRRIGDVYAECIKRGCELGFLKAFDTRVQLFPLRQTYSFFEMMERHPEDERQEELFHQWEIYLQVLLEKRQNHEKVSEWEKSLDEISAFQNKE